MRRTDKETYYLDTAQQIAKRSTCLRRMYGAVIVKDDEIIATGYNGSPRGVVNCCDTKVCRRDELGVKAGERYELCRSVHAEQNAIISASRKDMYGATLYLAGVEVNGDLTVHNQPCMMCKRFILNAGITKVVVRSKDGGIKGICTQEWVVDGLL